MMMKTTKTNWPSGNKIIKIKEILKEKVRISFSGNKRVIDDKKGTWCEVTWFTDGHFEINALSPCGIRASRSHIPFNPVTHESLIDLGWGDDKYDYNKEEI